MDHIVCSKCNNCIFSLWSITDEIWIRFKMDMLPADYCNNSEISSIWSLQKQFWTSTKYIWWTRDNHRMAVDSETGISKRRICGDMWRNNYISKCYPYGYEIFIIFKLKLILLAAHCCRNKDYFNVTAHFGAYKRKTVNNFGGFFEKVYPQNFLINEDYNEYQPPHSKYNFRKSHYFTFLEFNNDTCLVLTTFNIIERSNASPECKRRGTHQFDLFCTSSIFISSTHLFCTSTHRL